VLLALVGCNAASSSRLGYKHHAPVVMVGTGASTGQPSGINVDPKWADFPDYVEGVTRKVQRRWEKALANARNYPAIGSSVVVTFVMNSSGAVTRIVSVESAAGESAINPCVGAITESAPYGPWTDAMKTALGQEQQLTFTFYYQ
jgi:hypothetical protein